MSWKAGENGTTSTITVSGSSGTVTLYEGEDFTIVGGKAHYTDEYVAAHNTGSAGAGKGTDSIGSDDGSIATGFNAAAQSSGNVNTQSGEQSSADQIMEQMLLGNFYRGKPTIEGTAVQIVVSLTGGDVVMDLRDLFADFKDWNWGHFGKTLLDAAGLLPLIGAVKYVDEAGTVIKILVKNGDEVIEAGQGVIKYADEVADLSGSKVDDLSRQIAEWVGEDGRLIKNTSGDTVLISRDGTRRVRFDINNPSPHSSPHGHVEELINGKWEKSGPPYPTDVPKN